LQPILVRQTKNPATWFDDLGRRHRLPLPACGGNSQGNVDYAWVSLAARRARFRRALSTTGRQFFFAPLLPVQHPYRHSSLSLRLCP